MINFPVAPHFNYYECTCTNHSEHLEENRLRGFNKLYTLADTVLILGENIRSHFNKPVIVLSLYRYLELNRAVGSKDNSQHPKGEALDFYVRGVPLLDVFLWIWKESDIRWGQLILEPSWIHISQGYPLRERDRCGEVGIWTPNGVKLVL